MKIAVFEKTNFSKNQISQLEKIGQVDFYDGLTDEKAASLAPDYDVVVVNWIDPNPFILNMKPGSLVALLSTGYGWITNMEEAAKKGIRVANIPGYSTEAVAQHLLGLLLGVTKNIFPSLNMSKYNNTGFELQGKTVGIIGLGHIGSRFAEIMNFFGANLITYNRNRKNSPIAKDVSLDELLSQSDVICVTCSNNEESTNLINMTNYSKIKHGSILIGSTWGIAEENTIIKALNDGNLSYVSCDAAIEANNSKVSSELNALLGKRVFLTPHIAYNTSESEQRLLDICVNNIVSFANGIPANLVN